MIWSHHFWRSSELHLVRAQRWDAHTSGLKGDIEPDLLHVLDDKTTTVSLLQYLNVNPRARVAISSALKLELREQPMAGVHQRTVGIKRARVASESNATDDYGATLRATLERKQQSATRNMHACPLHEPTKVRIANFWVR